MHEPVPERSPGAWANETVSGLLCHPLKSAGLLEGTATGGVASYLKPNVAAALGFPAPSVHVPEREPDAVSGPLYVTTALQGPAPETSPGACVNEIVKVSRYQPSALGVGSALRLLAVLCRRT